MAVVHVSESLALTDYSSALRLGNLLRVPEHALPRYDSCCCLDA